MRSTNQKTLPKLPRRRHAKHRTDIYKYTRLQWLLKDPTGDKTGTLGSLGISLVSRLNGTRGKGRSEGL
jgi:hypothetical protein